MKKPAELYSAGEVIESEGKTSGQVFGRGVAGLNFFRELGWVPKGNCGLGSRAEYRY